MLELSNLLLLFRNLFLIFHFYYHFTLVTKLNLHVFTAFLPIEFILIIHSLFVLFDPIENILENNE